MFPRVIREVCLTLELPCWIIVKWGRFELHLKYQESCVRFTDSVGFLPYLCAFNLKPKSFLRVTSKISPTLKLSCWNRRLMKRVWVVFYCVIAACHCLFGRNTLHCSPAATTQTTQDRNRCPLRNVLCRFYTLRYLKGSPQLLDSLITFLLFR